VQLRCRRALALPPAESWRWLTEPSRLRLWLAEEVEATAIPGGALLLASAADGRRERGETVAVEPPRRWVLAFRRLDVAWPAATLLTLEISPQPRGSEVSALQSGFQDLPLSTCLTVWEDYRRRWRSALERRAAASALSPPATAP
jgi:uncharacterized protein YndB with AHSA1/START domain